MFVPTQIGRWWSDQNHCTHLPWFWGSLLSKSGDIFGHICLRPMCFQVQLGTCWYLLVFLHQLMVYSLDYPKPIDTFSCSFQLKLIISQSTSSSITSGGFIYNIVYKNTPSVSKQKLHLDIICITKHKVCFVKFLSNFTKRIGMVPKTM